MIKEIPFAGYTAQPSDYTAPDGTLAHSLNLLNEDGAVRPLFPPTLKNNLPDGCIPLLIHKTSSTNIICWLRTRSGSYTLGYFDSEKKEVVLNDIITFGKTYGKIPEGFIINAVGNTIVTCSTEGMEYFLWSVPSGQTPLYKHLGSHLPETPLSFRLEANTFQAPIMYYNCKNLNMPSGEGAFSEWDEPTQTGITEFILGRVNKFIADNSVAKGRFMFPFFVRYAYRLYDGSLTSHSAPILMKTTSDLPFEVLWVKGNDNEGKYIEFDTIVQGYASRLAYHIAADKEQYEILLNWKDIIKEIVIYISKPIYTYDQNGKCKKLIKVNDRISPKMQAVMLSPTVDSLGNELYEKSDYCSLNSIPGGYDSYTYMYRHREKLDSEINTNTIAYAGITVDIPRRKEEDIFNDIESTSTFYLLKTLDIEKDIATKPSVWTALEIPEDYMQSLLVRETMTDDYDSHDSLIAKYMFPYNQRLNLANLTKKLFNGFKSTAVFNYVGLSADNLSAIDLMSDVINKMSYYDIYVHLNIDNRDVIVCHKTGDSSKFYDLLGNDLNIDYFFYPNTKAYKATIVQRKSNDAIPRIKELPLKAHDFLNGAFYFSQWENLGNSQSGVPAQSSEEETIIPLLNKLYTSEINNPFLFPVTGITTIGTGEIRGISSAARALSQGQFGQFPLYAFSTEGIWALEVNPNTGGFTARQPISRDVVLNPESITQIDSAVLFATDRGIMHIAGSQVECISETIDSDFPFQPATLPHLLRLSNVLSAQASDSGQTILPFKDFLKSCRMAYDYINQRIYLYSTSHPYAYVYSLKSRSWGFVASSFAGSLNSYPEAYAIASDPDDNRIVDLSRPDTAASCPALLLTRPLKLDGPDILKTVDTVITRGDFRRGHVKSILYGSRDLRTWHPVWSSVDHTLRGFRGSPYKYFRLALLCDLQPDESISSASFQFSPRYTNSLR